MQRTRQCFVAMASITTQTPLKERLVGKTLYEVPTPSIVLDLAKLEINCQRMMDTAAKNGIGWRAHIKTHKVCVFPDGKVLDRGIDDSCRL